MSTVSDYFGCLVFDDRVMKANLSADVYASLRRTIDEGAKLDASVANAVAAAMKDWAVAHGATHYTHWFQPLTGSLCCQYSSSNGNSVIRRKARQLHFSRSRRRRHHGFLRQRADQGRA